MQYSVVQYSVVENSVLYYSVVKYNVMNYSVLQYGLAVQCISLYCNAEQCVHYSVLHRHGICHGCTKIICVKYFVYWGKFWPNGYILPSETALLKQLCTF